MSGGGRERDDRVPVFHHRGDWESRDICSTRLQGAFTLMSACHHMQDCRKRYMQRAWVHTPQTHTPYSMHCLSSSPASISRSPPKPTSSRRLALSSQLLYDLYMFVKCINKNMNPLIRRISINLYTTHRVASKFRQQKINQQYFW